MSRLVAVLSVACLFAAAGAPSATAATLGLSEARGAQFPDRAWILTLPEDRDVAAADVVVRENGRGVDELEVTAGSFATVLAIDVSESMHSGAIDQAMAAARAFAAERRADQHLGLILFSREHRVALDLTTDVDDIAAALAETPALTKGTQIYDATAAGISMLRRAKVRAGSIVVMSDGADAGSSTTPEALAAQAARTGVRVHAVGLASASFNEAALQQIAGATRGLYARAGGGDELAGIYKALGEQLSREYLVTYRSLAPLGRDVAVEAAVRGLAGVASAGYTTPALPQAPAATASAAGGWGSIGVLIAVVAAVALLLGLAVLVIARGPRKPVSDRIAPFVGAPRAAQMFDVVEPAGKPRRSGLFARWLERARWWPRFVERVELTDLGIGAHRLALLTATGTVFLVWLFIALGRPAAAVLLLLTPLAVNIALRAKVERVRHDFGDQLADTLQVVASAMRAGHSFEGGLSVAAQDAAHPMKQELQRVVHDERLGVPIDEAMAGVARRMESAEFDQIGTIVTIQRSAGGNIAELLDRAVDTIQYRADLKRLVRSLTAQGRFGGIVVTAMPPSIALLLSILQPGYFDPLLESDLGRILMGAAAGGIAIGWLIIRKIVDIKV